MHGGRTLQEAFDTFPDVPETIWTVAQTSSLLPADRTIHHVLPTLTANTQV